MGFNSGFKGLTETEIEKQTQYSWLRKYSRKKERHVWGQTYMKHVSRSGLQTKIKHVFFVDSSSNKREVGITNICLIFEIAAHWNQEEQSRWRKVLLCLQYVPQILVLVKGTDTRSRSCCRFCCVSFITSCHFQWVGQLRAPGGGHIIPLFWTVCVIYTRFVINSKYKIFHLFLNAPLRRKHHIFAVWEEGGISDFCRWVNEVLAPLGRYTANICNHLPTPRGHLSVLFSKNGLRDPWKLDRQVVSRCR